jgi:phosphate transport system ATP-binding protein
LAVIIMLKIQNLTKVYDGGVQALTDVSFEVPKGQFLAVIGLSGSGKSTLLRCINRLIEPTDGKIFWNGVDVTDASDEELRRVRRKIGMVFSRPVPLPLTIYENVAYGLMMAGERNKKKLDQAVEGALRQAVLWDEVYDRLSDSGFAISGGQQQRLCLARVLALEPEVIMLDEPTSALDPVSTSKIESLLSELKEKYTIILAPHNVQQAARMADYAAFFLMGELVEYSGGKDMFLTPKDNRTQDYIMGRFG